MFQELFYILRISKGIYESIGIGIYREKQAFLRELYEVGRQIPSYLNPFGC